MAIEFPEMPLDAWRPTKNTLHLYLQIVGKIRLAMHPRVNHWWHVPLYVSPRGLTTRAIPFNGGSFEIELDFQEHALKIKLSDGRYEDFALYDGLSVADFYSSIFANLDKLGIHPKIWAVPYEAPSTTPFAEDHENQSYDKIYIERFHQILVAVNDIFEEFRGRFTGKSTPVHLFWHSFDLALTRFSGRPAPAMPDANMVTREAYSHEVISFGFWFGDDKPNSVAAPAFYSYTAPKPDGLEKEPLQPDKAFWTPDGGMALLMFDDIRESANASKQVLEFLGSAYQAGAKTSNWDADQFEPPFIVNVHEEQFARNLVVAEKRERYLSMLGSKKGRKKLLEGFYHLTDLDERYATEIPAGDQSVGRIHGILRAKGSPDICHLISTNSALDDKELPLIDVLNKILGTRDDGTFISCIAGKLGYYEGEDTGASYI